MTGSGLSIRQLELTDMDAAAGVHRAAFDHALPWLTGLHTPDEDRWFYRERVFTGCQVHGAFEGGALTGIIAFRSDWIDQLYVLPEVQGRGVGSELLPDVSCRGEDHGKSQPHKAYGTELGTLVGEGPEEEDHRDGEADAGRNLPVAEAHAEDEDGCDHPAQ